MTRRKNFEDGPLSPLELNQYRLRAIAYDLAYNVSLPRAVREFLAGALLGIGMGDDANAALGVRAKRGERKTREQVAKRDNIKFALSWTALAIQPIEEGGKGMALEDAFAAASRHFKLEDGTLRTYWHTHPELQAPSFERPIWTFPERKEQP